MGLEVDLGDNGEMRVHFPSGKGKGHDIFLPISMEGMRVLKRLLMDHKRNPFAKLGEPGAPTQHQIKLYLAPERAKSAVKAVAKPSKMLEGLNFDDLDLNLE